MKKGTSFCAGCTDDVYNNGYMGRTECWSLKQAKVVTRYKIGWWSEPKRENFTKVKTYSCHREPGSYAFMETV